MTPSFTDKENQASQAGSKVDDSQVLCHFLLSFTLGIGALPWKEKFVLPELILSPLGEELESDQGMDLCRVLKESVIAFAFRVLLHGMLLALLHGSSVFLCKPGWHYLEFRKITCGCDGQKGD